MGFYEGLFLVLGACIVSFLYGIAWEDLRRDREKLKRTKEYFADIAKRTKEMEDKLAWYYRDKATTKYSNLGDTSKALNIK